MNKLINCFFKKLIQYALKPPKPYWEQDTFGNWRYREPKSFFEIIETKEK